MAWNSQCDSSEASDRVLTSDNVLTSTPVVPCSVASIDERRDSRYVDDSGYFTELKPVLAKPSFAEQRVVFPPLQLEISTEESSLSCEHISTQLGSCTVVSDSSTDCTSRSLENTGHECRLRLSDVTSNYASPDTEDRLTTIFNTVQEGCSSFVHHSLCGSLHKEDPVTPRQLLKCFSGSSHIDFISRLSRIPHVVAVILRHVSDADLCR